MKNKFEISVNPEENEEEVESVVTIHLFRHAEADRNPEIANKEFELSGVGRAQAMEKSKENGKVNLDQSVAFGSPRWRSMQAAGFVMGGESNNDITGEESFKELRSKLPFKIAADPRLDFYLDKNTPVGREMYKAVFEDYNLMEFMVKRSDSLAVQFHDSKASTYCRHARDVAKIVKKYMRIGDKWNKLVASGKYHDPNYERFLGTHGGPGESFLLKVIEKVKGTEERDRLLNLMPHQFDYTEGFDMTLINKGEEQTLHVTFKKGDGKNLENSFVFDEDVPLEVIDEIIEDASRVVISEKFNEWTEDKNELEARQAVFMGIRDIPYVVVSGRKAENGPEKLLIENKGSCTAKHEVLQAMLENLGIKTRYVSHRFKWSDLPVEYPNDVRELSERMPVCDHLFCQAFINGRWVSIDVAWDYPLKKAGFPVSEDWDGSSNTLTAVKPLEEIVHPDIESRTALKKELTESYTDEERKIQPIFYKKLNSWLDTIRSTSK